jgi:hypothetical protein
MGRLFENFDGVPTLVQPEGGGEAGDACADDRN